MRGANPSSSTGPRLQRAMALSWRIGTLVAVFLMGVGTGCCMYDKHIPNERVVNASTRNVVPMESLIKLRGVEECDLRGERGAEGVRLRPPVQVPFRPFLK